MESLHIHTYQAKYIVQSTYEFHIIHVRTYQWWEIEDNEEESIGYQVVGENEREVVGNGDASPAGEELQQKK